MEILAQLEAVSILVVASPAAPLLEMSIRHCATEIDCTAQVVELLLEQESIPSREFVARVAFALRNDVRVKRFVPVSKARFVTATPGSGTATLCTIPVSIMPSFLSNFSGRAVLIMPAMEGSSVVSAAPPPAPAPGLRE